ncbi:STN domain-containing protein [Cytophaga hutchinsonii]|uniref:Secretin/TonB short N-terminal domain-containing protein n=1 Tax=Cytophaga hutchinsonii (strain ATCC 33406 / DSM 1761 / CIP 103989 / NBRC 15051 / NCIMB 9469 / D465) TaxID=269798 RepID=A0A6N4SW80_CYTH3|nr:STN domain-containing protein [Cytophaga hutchinsonii]ABG60800.1 conserved hypothetical protein [Cytophaga hutchinsonii ATCC 33406]SFX72221.1 Secretin and TonB N terminus short domain-containing protein [Cytophaga hutchinsonii ATCC 33406]
MKLIKKLHLVILCLAFSIHISNAQILEKHVTMQFKNITLDEAIKKMKTTYGVNFTYSPDQINLNQKVSLNVKSVSLGHALNELFIPTTITYKSVGNQIVLKKGKLPSRVSTSGIQSISAKPVIKSDTTTKKVAIKDTMKNELTLQAKPLEIKSTDSLQATKELDQSYTKEMSDLNESYLHKKDSISTVAFSNKMKLKQSLKQAKNTLVREYNQLKDSIMYSKKFKNKTIDTTAALSDDDLLIHDNFQFTGIYPLGTHLTTSGLYRNDFSLNLLVGYNGAVSAFEFGGIGNIVRKEMQGFQFAGVVNTVGGYVRGTQVAGIVNICNQEVIGGQVSGILNIANGATSGGQIAGVVNVGTEQMDGVQISGVVNEHNGIINGGQIGLINHAHKVKGFQLGFINISDTIQGIPIGLLSISKNGYGRIETYYSETTQGNLLIKTGVKSFYNIFQFGGNFNSDSYRWTFGYGLGSTIHMSKRSTLSFDVLAMHVNENEAFTSKLNEQGQLRIMLGVNLSKRVSLFAGPTFNTMFSQYKNEDATIGSQMIPQKSVVYEQTIKDSDGKNIYNPYWIGFNAGLRF